MVTPGACPYCGKRYRRINPQNNVMPGNFTICMGCVNVLVFNDDFTLRKPLEQEAMAASRSPFLFQLQSTVRQIHATRKGMIVAGGGNA